MKIDYYKRTMTQNIGIVFVSRSVFSTAKTRKWRWCIGFAVADANLIENVWVLIKFKLWRKKIWTVK